MKKILVGLTGLSCSGKNYIGALLEKRGLPVIDLDKTAHGALNEDKIKSLVTARWGKDLLDGEGKINRKLLGGRVFSKPEELKALEAIIHPAVDRLTDEWIAGNVKPVLIINAAVIHRASVFRRLDFLIVVRASIFTRFIRAKLRDKLTVGQILRRFQSQADFPRYYAGKQNGKRGKSGKSSKPPTTIRSQPATRNPQPATNNSQGPNTEGIYLHFFDDKADNLIISINNEGAGFFSRFFRKKLEKQVDNLVKMLEKTAKEKE